MEGLIAFNKFIPHFILGGRFALCVFLLLKLFFFNCWTFSDLLVLGLSLTEGGGGEWESFQDFGIC